MIDLDRLQKIRLSPRPFGQRIAARLFIVPSYRYRLPGSRTEIVLEGEENVARDGGVIYVMNHTDRYNYWPFQLKLFESGYGFTATWVKGKYYESRALGWFMDSMNNIPLPSRGYVLSKDFAAAVGRAPSDAEYAVLRQLADGEVDEAAASDRGGPDVRSFLSRAWPDAPSGRYVESLERRFERMMARVVEISEEALRMGLSLLVFPQGTRSVRLTPGHVGVAQVALHARATVVPVGCNGSDRCYPGNSPWSRGGRIVYRVGPALRPDGALAPFRIDAPFTPFTSSAEPFRDRFRGATDLFMARINDLLDPEYRFAGAEADSPTGASRFL